MANKRTLASWKCEGTHYSVKLHLENDQPTGMTIEAVTGDKTRRAELPIEFGSLEWYAQVWSETKSAKQLTAAAERALGLAERFGYGD
jgi:hypothetical protein